MGNSLKAEVSSIFQSTVAQEITNQLERKIAQIICKKASTDTMKYTLRNKKKN